MLVNLLLLLVVTHALSNDLWDSWYTIKTSNGKELIRYGKYHETVQESEGRIIGQISAWKKERGFVKNEQIGAAIDKKSNEPIFFNYLSTLAEQNIKIDGTFKKSENTRTLTTIVKLGKTKHPTKEHNAPQSLVLSTLFSYWLSNQYLKLTPKNIISFKVLYEDDFQSNFSPKKGTAEQVKDDAFSTLSKTMKVRITIGRNKTFWYLDKKGHALRIQSDQFQWVSDRVNEKTAEKFLPTK